MGLDWPELYVLDMTVVDTGSPAGRVRVSVMTERDGVGAACVVVRLVPSMTARSATRKAMDSEFARRMVSEVKAGLLGLYEGAFEDCSVRWMNVEEVQQRIATVDGCAAVHLTNTAQ